MPVKWIFCTARIGRLDCRRKIGTRSRDAEHAASARDQLAVAQLCSGVKNDRARSLGLINPVMYLLVGLSG